MDGPYIGQIGDGVILVAGGNGYGANCCDEIGRIGAKLATRFLLNVNNHHYIVFKVLNEECFLK